MAVSVCTTPAAPSPLPIPYPTTGTVTEGIIDAPMRTTIEGRKILTVGGCMKACHGNEPGTMREVASGSSGSSIRQSGSSGGDGRMRGSRAWSCGPSGGSGNGWSTAMTAQAA
ncbi:PAAR-like domain-containing protein [Sorangium sp. So ce764]